MPPYVFALQNDTTIERLGAMAMRDDNEAVDFAEQLARDLARSQEETGVALAIIRDEQIVRKIPLE